MEFIYTLFLHTFSILFSIFFQLFKHPVLSTYLFILVLVIFCSYKFFHFLKKSIGGKGSFKEQFKNLIFVVLEIYLISFTIWYVVVHFKTFRVI